MKGKSFVLLPSFAAHFPSKLAGRIVQSLRKGKEKEVWEHSLLCFIQH